jgi:hypothetical protein
MESSKNPLQEHQQNNLAEVITAGKPHHDLVARLAKLKAQAEQSNEVLKFFPAPAWKPKIGECLAGIFLGRQIRDTRPGEWHEPHVEDWQILIQDESGRVHAIWGTPELKRQLWGEASPGVEHGNLIAITFLGIRFTSDGFPYKSYGVMVDKLNGVRLGLFI